MMEAELMVLNSSTLANDNSSWPKLAPSFADIVAEVRAVGVGGRPDPLIRSIDGAATLHNRKRVRASFSCVQPSKTDLTLCARLTRSSGFPQS